MPVIFTSEHCRIALNIPLKKKHISPYRKTKYKTTNLQNSTEKNWRRVKTQSWIIWQLLSNLPGFDPLGVTDEAFGTVTGPQQVAVRLLPGGRGSHTLHCDK